MWQNPASTEAEQDPYQLGKFCFLWSQVFCCTMEIDIAWQGPWLYFLHLFAPLSQPLVCLKHFPAFPSLQSPVFAGGLRATPAVARNAKTFGSLKSLTLKFKALVLHNLDWAESSSIKVIGNHWDILRHTETIWYYLYLFVNRLVFFDCDALGPSRGDYVWLQDELGRTYWWRRVCTQARRIEVLPHAGVRFLPGLSALLWDSHLKIFEESD